MNFALAVLSAVLLMALFPPWNATLLAPFALTPILIGMARERRWSRRLIYGEIAGIIYWSGVCYWIQWVLEFHGGMTVGLSWLAFALFAIAKGSIFALFAVLAGPVMRRSWALPGVAALWVGLERLNGPQGFAWLLLGNAGSDMGLPLRLAPFTGAYGLSFVFALLAAGFASVLCRYPRIRLVPLIATIGLPLLPTLPPPERGEASAAAVQPNVDQGQSWTEEEASRLLQRVVLASFEAAFEPGQPAPALLLWPESPAPFYFDTDPAFREEAQRIARVTRTYFLFGTVTYTPSRQPLNSAVLLDPSGEPVSRYDKMYLVPFGEFVPSLFSWVNRITNESGDFVPGKDVVVSSTEQHRLGAFICYESAFPHLVRRFAQQGAEVLVNLTNDGYFGHSAARQQHLLLARMRAAENRRWLLRPTNDGITVSIDPAGRIRQQFPPFEQTGGRLRFSWISDRTVYTRWGDWFAWTCLAGGLGAFVVALIPQFERVRG
jgi:apolipoprotein N-acyltransferase